jgi:hypothetical protein
MAAKQKADDLTELKVRINASMRNRIEREAKKANRSLNQEINYRLGVSFGAEGVALAGLFEQREKDMAGKFRELWQQLEKLIAAEQKKE